MMEIGEVDKQMMIKVNDGDDSVLGLTSTATEQPLDSGSKLYFGGCYLDKRTDDI